MANNCRIPRKDVKSAPTRADLIAFAKENLIPELKAIYNNPNYYTDGVINPTKIKQAVTAHLQSLGRKYVPDDYQYIEEAVNILTESPAFKFIKNILPPGKIINLLTLRGNAEKVSTKVFTDTILDDTTSENDAIDFFLHNAFGSATLAKTQLERRMTNTVLNSFIIDRENGVIVPSIEVAMQKVNLYKKEMLKDIQAFLKDIGINSAFITANIDELNVNNVILKYQKLISQYLQVGLISEDELQQLYDDSTNGSLPENVRTSAKLKLQAYGSWLALQHFDNFIKMSLGDTIIINPSSTSERYSYSSKGTNVNTTWRKDDNIDLQAEINKLTQALINTSPVFVFGSLIPTSDAYLQFSDFSYITAKVKDLVYDPQSSTIFIDKIPYIYDDLLTPEEQLLVKNKSFRHIISSSRYNPQKYLPVIYKILTSGNSTSGYFIDKFKQFNKQDKNIVWSVFKNIYDSNFTEVEGQRSIHSLYNIQRTNPNSRNYFATVSSVADCIFSVDFTHYVYEEGVLKVKSLRDSAVGKTLMEITDVINNKNSHELVKNFKFESYGVTEIEEKSVLDGISFKINLSSDSTKPDYLYIHVTKKGESIKFSKSENPSGKALTYNELIALDDNPAILEFFDEVLGLNLTHNTDFRNTLKELMAQKSDSVSNYMTQMLSYASHVFFNRYFSETYLSQADTKSKKKGIIAKYFKDDESAPKFKGKFFNMEMTPKKKHPILLTIAQALGTTRGLNSSRQVKDADMASLSSQTLSRLLGNMAQQMDIQIKAYGRLHELEAELQALQKEVDESTNQSFKNNQAPIIREKQAEIERFRRDSYLLDTTQNPAAMDFDLINSPGLFLGVVKSEEIKGVTSNKKQVKFTTAEAVTSSFLHNFVLGHCVLPASEKNFEFGNNIVGLLPSVNSDKTTVSIAKFDLNTKVLQNRIEQDFAKLSQWAMENELIAVPITSLDEFKSFNDWVRDLRNKTKNKSLTTESVLLELIEKYNQTHQPLQFIPNVHYSIETGTGNIGISKKTYAKLTNQELLQVIRYEIGSYYNTMYNNIKDDFSKISEILGIPVNPDSGFSELNDWIDAYNENLPVGESPKRADTEIFNAVMEYNRIHPNNPIRLIDQIHYITDKKTGRIRFNNTIKALKRRFSSQETTNEFFALKSTEVLKSVLDSGFSINLYGKSSLDDQPEIVYLRELNDKYIEKFKQNWINQSGQMVIAKITIDGVAYDVASINDLKLIEKVLTVKRMVETGKAANTDEATKLFDTNPDVYKRAFGYDRLSTKIHKLTGMVQLHPMLDKYNLMDYLFTQQYMYSTVGSHVAHPAKAKIKTPIIWAHPAIGKSYAVNQAAYSDKFMDWDVEFNRRRDAWVAKHSNTELGSNEFRKQRSYYQMNWESIPEYQEFVKREWKRITTKAKDENKILVASPHMLLRMFSDQFDSVLTMSEDTFIQRSTERGDSDPVGWKSDLDATINALSTNPVFARKVKTIESDEYLTTLVDRGKLSKELAILSDNEMAEEASRFYAQHKRNVSFTASMSQFQLNQLDGIPTWYNIAVIKDIEQGLFTVDGNTNAAKPYDGATFVNPFIVYLENNSLNEARAGIDKKQFVHFYDELTGTGGIIKTAGFGITNDRMRNSEFYRDLMYKMTNQKWRTATGEPYIGDITKDFNGNSIDYGTFYFRRGNKYYEATIECVVETSTDSEGNTVNSLVYKRTMTEINKFGTVIGETTVENFVNIDNNYDLWQLFGGMNSMEFNGGVLQGSETSIQNVVKAMINHGYKKPGWTPEDITSEFIEQPLKNADIHYIPTEGAVKQGIANVNPNTLYRGDGALNSYRIRMTNAGIQLDKEHHADGAKLSLMTQVISSACSMGYNPREAKRLYSALYQLTLQGIKPFISSFKTMLNPSSDPEFREQDLAAFETTIAECMVKNMLTSTAQDGDMLRAIATDLIQKVREGKKLTAADAKTIPYSDPAVFNKLVSNLSVIMTKSGIKAKMDGILSVLCPTQGIVKMYDFVDNKGVRHTLTLSQLEEKFAHLWAEGDTDYTFTNKVMDQIQSYQKPMYNDGTFDSNNITIGKKYIVKFEDYTDINGEFHEGYEVVVDVTYPHDTGSLTGKHGEIVGYQALKNLLRDGHIVYGKVAYIQEYVKEGNDLKTVNFKFKDSSGNSYQVWDIDYIQDLFTTIQLVDSGDLSTIEKINTYKDLIIKYEGDLTKFNEAKTQNFSLYANGGILSDGFKDEHELQLLKRYARQIQQNILFALSKNNPNKIPPIKIGGNDVLIDKSSIEIDAYELVMPKVFIEEFGLDNYANLNDILKDKDYFYNKMVNNFSTKVLDETHYDIELKRANGNHVYIKERTGIQQNWDRDLEKVQIHTQIDESGKVWRMDLMTGKKMYQLFHESDEVYRIPGTDVEIILTSTKKVSNGDKTYPQSGITFYLNTFKYQSIHISEAIADGKNEKALGNERPRFEDMLYRIEKSSNKHAKSWINLFKNEDGSWVNNKTALNSELNDFDTLKPSLRNHLREQATIMHTSLEKSLDVIAARIPAQNQQSFMPMKVVAWDNPNINTAYVSVMQFFLQGSDLDIDAVSLLTFSFSPGGEFYSWSPDFDLSNSEMLNLSMNLPFPTGEELKIINYESSEEHVKIKDRHPLLTDNEHYKALLAEQQRKEELPEDYASLLETNPELREAEYEASKNALIHYIALLEDIQAEDGIIYFDSIDSERNDFTQALIKRINRHNAYIQNSSDKIAEGAIKNYVVGALHSIASDAANWLEAHTGVDVATSPLKAIAGKSELSEVQKTFTPGNALNKFQAIEEASVGKDDIAICATGLKGFFAATQFCNDFLNQKFKDPNLDSATIAELANIVTFNPITIGGKLFTSLANIRIDDLEMFDEQSDMRRSTLYNILKNKGFEDDASVIMSALLSLSTDNAKDLALAKINAGTGMIGMYLYGAAIGMDFKVMNKIIASPLGFTVAKLLNSNEFTLQKGRSSINSVLNYLVNGPTLYDLKHFNVICKVVDSNHSTHNVVDRNIKKVLDNEDNLELKNLIYRVIGIDANDSEFNLTTANIGKVIAALVKDGSKDEAYQLLSLIRESVNTNLKGWSPTIQKQKQFKGLHAMCNQMIDFLEEFVEQTSTLHNNDYETEYGISNITVDFNKLALGADEFKRLGQLLRLNQEIKTKPDELISFVQKIETIISSRISIIKSTAARIGLDELGIEDDSVFEDAGVLDFMRFAEDFISNKDGYHQEQIDIYERACKSCINPLRILTSVDHYKGYFTSMILAYEGDYTKSVKFRAIKHLGNQFIDFAQIHKSKEQTGVFKGVQSFVDDYINNSFLRSQAPIHLPKTSESFPVSMIDVNGKTIPNTYDNTYIQLGTDVGNANFEKFFEEVFIPALRQQCISNQFVDDLTPLLIIDPITGDRYTAITLPINMMPSSDNERILFNKHKNGFNKIANTNVTINGESYSVIRMFHYYNLLKFRGKSTRNSLTRIFEDKTSTDGNLIRYRRFINEFDATYDFVLNEGDYEVSTSKIPIKVDVEVLAPYLAPTVRKIRHASTKLVKFKNEETGEMILLIKKTKEDPSNNYEDDDTSSEAFGDENNQYEDMETESEAEVDDDVMVDDAENGVEKVKMDYGDYVEFAGVGVLTKFNPPTLKPAERYSQIIDYYNVEGTGFKNVTISGGKVKQFTYNGEIVDVDSNIRVITIVKTESGTTYKLDEEALTNILKTKLC